MEAFGRFDFNDQLVIDDHVQALLGDHNASIHDVYSKLSSHPVTSMEQLELERRRVNVLQIPEAEFLVHGVESADDRACEEFFDESHATNVSASGPRTIIKTLLQVSYACRTF